MTVGAARRAPVQAVLSAAKPLAVGLAVGAGQPVGLLSLAVRLGWKFLALGAAVVAAVAVLNYGPLASRYPQLAAARGAVDSAIPIVAVVVAGVIAQGISFAYGLFRDAVRGHLEDLRGLAERLLESLTLGDQSGQVEPELQAVAAEGAKSGLAVTAIGPLMVDTSYCHSFDSASKEDANLLNDIEYHWESAKYGIGKFKNACEKATKYNKRLSTVGDRLIEGLREDLHSALLEELRAAPKPLLDAVDLSESARSGGPPEQLLEYAVQNVIRELVEQVARHENAELRLSETDCEQKVSNINSDLSSSFRARLSNDGWIGLSEARSRVLKLSRVGELIAQKEEIEKVADRVLKGAVTKAICNALKREVSRDLCSETESGRVTLAECLDSLANERWKRIRELEDAKRELEEDLRYVARAEFLPPDRVACKYILGRHSAR